jgi:hypothetical protein
MASTHKALATLAQSLWVATRGAGAAALVLLAASIASGAALPAEGGRAPVAIPHFPDTLHAVVWRNWGLVEPDRLAKVLGTDANAIQELAVSMGLPAEVAVPASMRTRGYITLIRRNWHLLPFDQLLELLGIGADELAFRLREDDFLFIKLGSLKPHCPVVRYAPPEADARARAREIRGVVERYFPGGLAQDQELRFAFVEQFANASPRAGESPVAAAGHDDEALRFIFSYCAIFGDSLLDDGLSSFPEGLLEQLSRRGVNGVWLHAVLRQLAPGGATFPEFGERSGERLENLRRLVERAARHGIKVYLYLNEPRAMPVEFFVHRPDLRGVGEGDFAALCTSRPEVRQWLTDGVAHVFHEVPGLGGVFTITASENLTNCSSHGQQESCPHCQGRTQAEIVGEFHRAIMAGVRRESSAAKVIAYDWGWGDNAPSVIRQLPDGVWVLSVSEWGTPIQRGGVESVVGEYALSAVGPGPQARRNWGYAQQRQLPTAAKVQLNNSWELASVPYLPVLDLVGEHCERLRREGIDGLMLSWSLGGYPSLNLELAALVDEMQEPHADAALQTLAEKHYGAAAAPHVRRAWTAFSRAFGNYPFHVSVLYNGPQHLGPANLLYGEPTGYAATMVGIPYDDLRGWCGPYPPDVLARQMQAVAEGWDQGIAELAVALPLVPAELAEQIESDLRVAKAAREHFASVAQQVRFIAARDRAQIGASASDLEAARREQVAILDAETASARRLFDLASADSRLGYEPSNHYFYVPFDLVEKIVNCEHLKAQLEGLSAASTP